MSSGPGRGANGSPTNEERYHLFGRAWMCCEGFSSFPYLAIYWLHFRDEQQDNNLYSPLFENDDRLHAEDHLLNHLLLMMTLVNRDKISSITIMQNASPCFKCSDKYKGALEGLVKDAGISVSITFSAFHWVRRVSCREQSHQHPWIHIDKHENNRQGFRDLRDVGLTVRTTEYEDWIKLAKALQILPIPTSFRTRGRYRTTPRAREDDNLKYDLDHLLS